MPASVEPTAARLRASVVLIGDELLDGYVADQNGHWLAARLSHLGIPLDRVQTVPDHRAAIGEALALELSRDRPRVVITSGGIGSTPDDLTMSAVADHLHQSLITHPDIAARIDGVIRRSAAAGTPIDVEQASAMRRMALVPAGSRVLTGSAGMVPGVVVDIDGGSANEGGASVVVLPGVPDQFRDIVERAVEPEMLSGRGLLRHTAEFVHDHPESAFTAVLQRLNDQFPDMDVGSYPRERCVIRLKGSRNDVDSGLAQLRDHAARLERDPGAIRRRDAWRDSGG